MHIEDFLKEEGVLLDVRSPSEFIQGHIPGATSFPIFSDEERAKVGTVYKQEGHESAVLLGFELLGPKLAFLARQGRALDSKKVRVYCARGGLRSEVIAWILQTAGLDTTRLTLGYKAFRKWALERFKVSYDLRVLGGFTGSGKTDFLYQLQGKGKQILDLEKLACHRGSSFGHLGNKKQPSVEHFENQIAMELSFLNKELPIWIEDESRMIGSCQIPSDLFDQMRKKPLYLMKGDKRARIERLFKQYGEFAKEDLADGVRRLEKKLGLVKTEEIIKKIYAGEIREFIALILEYYDQRYTYGMNKIKRGFESYL
jgi:tRNA 2-selenouridine synthase